MLSSAHRKQPYGRAGDYQRQHRPHSHEHGESTCVGSHAVMGDRLANHALLGRGALDVAYVLVGVGVIVVVLVLAFVALVLAELVLACLVRVMLVVPGDPPVGFTAFVVVVAFVLVGLAAIVVAVAYVLVGVTVIVVVLVLAVVVVVVPVLAVLVVVVAFVPVKDADLLLIPTAARRSGSITPGGRASNLSSSRGARARSSLTGPEGVSVSQVGGLRGEVNYNCLGAVVADGDVLLNRTVARRSGGITRGGACGGTCCRRGAVNYAVTYNMTSFSTDASGAYYGEGVVWTPGKHIILRIYGYRYDQLVRVLSCGLGEGLP